MHLEGSVDHQFTCELCSELDPGSSLTCALGRLTSQQHSHNLKPHCGGFFFLFFENFERMQRNSKTRCYHSAETSAIESSSRSGLEKVFHKLKFLNLNFQRFFGYITSFSNFQILIIVFWNAEFHNGPTRYLEHTRDLRRSHKKFLIVPAALPCTCLSCFLFAYVAEI